MPKENIKDHVIDGFRLEVSWVNGGGDGNGHVQLATVNQGSPFKFAETEEFANEEFDGWRVTLDREGINRTIRHLRRARDAAFGADA